MSAEAVLQGVIASPLSLSLFLARSLSFSLCVSCRGHAHDSTSWLKNVWSLVRTLTVPSLLASTARQSPTCAITSSCVHARMHQCGHARVYTRCSAAMSASLVVPHLQPPNPPTNLATTPNLAQARH